MQIFRKKSRFIWLFKKFVVLSARRLAVNYSPFRQRFSPINGDNLTSEITFAPSCKRQVLASKTRYYTSINVFF